MKKLINNLLICAPNINEGGPLTILNQAIESAIKNFSNTKIYIITNNKNLINIKNKRIKILEYPESKRSWLSRLYHEFYVFKNLSLKLNIDVWISLQDITSIIHSKYQVVYCHCPIPFYKLRIRDIYFEPASLIRNLFYNIIYRLNIHKNDLIIVQQEWLRKEFTKMTGHKKIIVAKPILDVQKKLHKKTKQNKKKIFIYPTLPRFHKNIELICDAVNLIGRQKTPQFVVKITISGNENKYAAYLKKKYSHLKEIKFIGLQSNKNMDLLYKEADALIFPSKLETWGLPVSEAISYKLPIMISNLDYSRETLGQYTNVSFFDPRDPKQLMQHILVFLEDRWKPQKFRKIKSKKLFANNWQEMWNTIENEFYDKCSIK